jgi:hypothetical protein
MASWMPSVLTVLRVLALGLGVFFIYIAAFTYETTDKRIQSRLEDFWVRLADFPRTPAGLIRRLARAVLTLMDGIFDRLFGARQLSIRTVSVAAWFVLGAVILSLIPTWSFLGLLAGKDIARDIERWPVLLGVAFVGIGTLPFVRPSLAWMTYTGALSGVVGWTLIAVWNTVVIDWRPIALVAGVVTLPYGIAVIHAIRHAVRTSNRREATGRGLLLLGGLLAIALAAFAVLAWVAILARDPTGPLTRQVYSLMRRPDVFDLLFHVLMVFAPWGFGLTIALALSLVVVLHVALWPAARFILMKTLYAAQRHELIRRKATLWSIGLGLGVCAIAPPGELVTRIIEAARNR